ncbi:precorrin-8X methylmutase [Prochlorococcus sp. MIT 1341]|uniref:precorrin-8X methylmutase n=1 Tax=Prochlorococcus sp. MIT 1341 TaxID=3096221 RepID=UPI002A7534ED|nr:precorrin-8X methylmutase [Prochlorococcus sp. MIT 1341]
MKSPDHPIFIKSVQFIRERLDSTGLDPLQQEVLERLIHSSGDFALMDSLRFSASSCEIGVNALLAGASILVDTGMAHAGVEAMARRTLGTSVYCSLNWATDLDNEAVTRSARGMTIAWQELTKKSDFGPAPIVLIGSAPTALNALLDLVEKGFAKPSLVIGMPVGFIGVSQSKTRLAATDLANIRLTGSRGGAGLAAATLNALLRAAYLKMN